MSDAIDIRRVVKRYGTFTALHGVSLTIRDNEFFTLLGPSGCGKTTLLRMIAGFEDVTAGEILLFGQNIAGLEPDRRPVNTVFQNYALFPHMSVLDNVAFGLKMKGMAAEARRARAGKMLEMVHLSAFADRLPAQLSGGQQQRVALARALAPEPRVLLLDEPLSALDLKLRQAMRVELKQLQEETGITFIFVTHDQEEALTMSDRIVVLNGGHVQQLGSPEDIYDRPANAFVAGFIGESNLFDGRVTRHHGDAVEFLTAQGDTLRLRRTDLVPGQKLQAMLRPEQFHLACPGDPARHAFIEGRVLQQVFIGKDFELSVRTLHGSPVKAVLRAPSRELMSTLEAGARVQLWYATDAPHLLLAQEARP